MRKLRLPLSSSLLIIAALGVLSCGSSQNQFRSLTISPASADAKDYPNGQVQYTATATYINGRQTQLAIALWTPGPPWSLTSQMPWPAIQLSQTGVAACGQAGTGTFMIVATAPIDPSFPVSKMTMMTPQVTGSALLTCP